MGSAKDAAGSLLVWVLGAVCVYYLIKRLWSEWTQGVVDSITGVADGFNIAIETATDIVPTTPEIYEQTASVIDTVSDVGGPIGGDIAVIAEFPAQAPQTVIADTIEDVGNNTWMVASPVAIAGDALIHVIDGAVETIDQATTGQDDLNNPADVVDAQQAINSIGEDIFNPLANLFGVKTHAPVPTRYTYNGVTYDVDTAKRMFMANGIARYLTPVYGEDGYATSWVYNEPKIVNLSMVPVYLETNWIKYMRAHPDLIGDTVALRDARIAYEQEYIPRIMAGETSFAF